MEVRKYLYQIRVILLILLDHYNNKHKILIDCKKDLNVYNMEVKYAPNLRNNIYFQKIRILNFKENKY